MTDTDQAPPAAPGPRESDAPYGRRVDGTPAKKRGPKGPRKAASGTPAPRKRTTPAKPKPPDYTPGLTEVITLIGAGVGLLPGEVWKADGAAVQMWAPGLAEGGNELAQLYPEVAALFDKIVMTGPALKIAKPLAGLGLQLATNHRLLPAPVAVNLGAVPREALLTELRRRGEEMAAAGVTDYTGPHPEPEPAPEEPTVSFDQQFTTQFSQAV